MKKRNKHSIDQNVPAETPLPEWLSACDDTHVAQRSGVTLALLEQQYMQIFERIIERMYRGDLFKTLISEETRLVSHEHFVKWIKKDSNRKARFEDAQELRTVIMSDEVLEISDGVNTIDPTSSDTVNRDKLRIDTRKFLMASHNRARYAQTTKTALDEGSQSAVADALKILASKLPV